MTPQEIVAERRATLDESPSVAREQNEDGAAASTGAGSIHRRRSQDELAGPSYDRPIVLAFGNCGIGDRLLTLPTVQALEALFGNALTVACDPFSATSIYSGLRDATVCTAGVRFRDDSHFDADALAEAVGGCDLVVSVNTGLHVEMPRLLHRLGPKHSIGYFSCFDTCLSHPLTAGHVVDGLFRVVQALRPGLTADSFRGLPVSSAHRAQAAMLMSMLPEGTRILGVHVDTKPRKIWPVEGMRRLVHTFLGEHREFVVFVLGYGGRTLEDGPHADRIVCVDRFPLATLFATIGYLDAFVGVDSCFLHAADLHEIPSVGLFGPTDPRQWGIRFAPHRHLREEPLDRLTVSEVLDALRALLG